MAKINIIFNDINYSISESAFAEAVSELQQHLLTTMSGTGAVINLGGVNYNVDAGKLSTTTADFISHLGEIAGSGSKVVVGGNEYYFDSTKVQSAISDLETVLGNLNNSDVVDIVIVLDEAILDHSTLG